MARLSRFKINRDLSPLKSVIIFFWFFIIVSIIGCSSLITDSEVREKQFSLYLSQPEPLIMYYPDTLQLDEQLKALGFDDYATPMLKPFYSAMATRGLIERFVADAPLFSGLPVRIVDLTQLASSVTGRARQYRPVCVIRGILAGTAGV